MQEDNEPPRSSRQLLAEQLAAEHEQMQRALSEDSARRAESRSVLLQQAKQRAQEREDERAQVSFAWAQTRSRPLQKFPFERTQGTAARVSVVPMALCDHGTESALI